MCVAWPDKIELLETIMFGTTANNSPKDISKSDHMSMRTKRNDKTTASVHKTKANKRKSAVHAGAHNQNHILTLATMTEDHRHYDGRKEDMNDIPASVRDEL